MSDTASRIEVDRPLTVQERAVIAWLLAHGDGDNAAFAAQLDQARVCSHCTCGCASIDLTIAGRRSSGPLRVLADFQWTTEEGHLCGAFVFEQDGLLGGLDLWSIDAGTVPSSLPAIEDLMPFGTRTSR